MTAIIRSSLRFRLLVVAVAAGVLAVGIAQLRSAPVDVLPEFTPPYAEIQTEALGLSATEVENLITVPLEADLLNGVEGVKVIRSESLPGLSSVVLVFEPGTDIYRARQLVQERLAHAHALPKVSKPPTLLQPLSSSGRVLMIGLSSERVSPIEQSVIARWTMRPRLMGVAGVANVAVWGLRDQQIQVQVDPEQLRDRAVTLSQVVKTAGNAQVVSPLSFLEASTPGSGGFIETPQQRLQVRHVLERLADPAELGKVPVGGHERPAPPQRRGRRQGGSPAADRRRGRRRRRGSPARRRKVPGRQHTRGDARRRGRSRDAATGLSGIRTDTSVFRPATFIEDAIDNLTVALIVGGALAALALAALLFQWRTVLVTVTAIPLALVAAALVLDALGETFNAISFAGLAAAVAVVVDDAVVGAESVARRLRRARADGRGASTATVVLDASTDVRRPLAYATVIALMAVVPIAVMEGRPGAFFESLALAYALAVLAATVVAMTVTPALTLLLFSRGTPALHESPILRWLRPRYDVALERFLGRSRAPLLAVGACLVVGVALVPLLDTSLIPTFKDRNVLVHLDGEPGTSNPRMTQIATAVSRDLRKLPGVDNVGAHVGRAVTGDQRVDVNSSEVWASVASGADYEGTVRQIEDAVARVPGVQPDVATYSSQKIRDVGALEAGENRAAGAGFEVLTGSERPLVARIYGHDLGELRNQAEQVRRTMSGVDGVVDPRIDTPREQPNLVIEADLSRAQRLAIKPGDIRRAEATLLQGIQVGSVFEDQKVFDVLVVGVPATRRTVADVRNLLIDRPRGGHVRLGQVADVRIEQTPVAIQREAVSRYIDVEAGVAGRSSGAVAGDLRARLADLRFPLEYHAEVLAATASEEIGATAMLAFAIVAAFTAFLLLQAAFRSWRLAAVAFLLLPAALVGGLAAALIDGAGLTLGSVIAFLALLGIAARNTVLSIRHFQELERGQNGSLGSTQLRRGAQDRLAPVLTTAAVVALLALPLVVLGTRPGLEVVHAMGVVVLGGLVTSTLLALFVLPAVCARFPASAVVAAAADGAVVTQWQGIENADTDVPSAANGPQLGARDAPARAEAQESER